MMIDKRHVVVRLKRWLTRWLTTCRQRPRQANRGPATARLPTLIAEAVAGDQRALRALAAIVVRDSAGADRCRSGGMFGEHHGEFRQHLGLPVRVGDGVGQLLGALGLPGRHHAFATSVSAPPAGPGRGW